MIKTFTNQAIALAGLSQAVYLVQEIAKRGYADREAMATVIGSVLKIDADDVVDVYGGLEHLRTGLQQLERQLAGPDRADTEQARYASTLIFLERRLMKQPTMVEAIGSAVREAAAVAEQAGVLGEDVLKRLAEVYQRTLSALQPRVLVTGEKSYLSDPDNACTIRALLLAGIRSAVLWRQCGGSRWNLLFHRLRLRQETLRLLSAL